MCECKQGSYNKKETLNSIFLTMTSYYYLFLSKTKTYGELSVQILFLLQLTISWNSFGGMMVRACVHHQVTTHSHSCVPRQPITSCKRVSFQFTDILFNISCNLQWRIKSTSQLQSKHFFNQKSNLCEVEQSNAAYNPILEQLLN